MHMTQICKSVQIGKLIEHANYENITILYKYFIQTKHYKIPNNVNISTQLL